MKAKKKHVGARFAEKGSWVVTDSDFPERLANAGFGHSRVEFIRAALLKFEHVLKHLGRY